MGNGRRRRNSRGTEEQEAVDDFVNLSQVQLNIGGETDDNQVLSLD